MEKPLRILLVEDSPEDGDLLRFHLESHRLACEITRVESLDAFRLDLAAGGWDLVLSDFLLPGANGLDVLLARGSPRDGTGPRAHGGR